MIENVYILSNLGFVMVRVSFNLGKRDFIWIGIIIVLVGVGFGYAYDSGLDPDVMGHSSDEIEFRKIAALGAESKYGALTIEGIKNNWGGINFKDGLTNFGTLMVREDYQGFYNDADNGWDWHFRNGVLTAGTVPWARISGAPTFTDTNAKTLCANNLFLDGDGQCRSAAQILAAAGTVPWARITGAPADTNSESVCANNLFLDGDGQCRSATQIVSDGGGIVGTGVTVYECPKKADRYVDLNCVPSDPNYYFCPSYTNYELCLGQITTSNKCTSTIYHPESGNSNDYIEYKVVNCGNIGKIYS